MQGQAFLRITITNCPYELSKLLKWTESERPNICNNTCLITRKAREMYDGYSAVLGEGEYPWLAWRDIVISRKKPRNILVQVRLSHGFLNNDAVSIIHCVRL